MHKAFPIQRTIALFSCLILFLCSNKLTAQNLSGKISDAKTGETLIGATIALKGTTKGAQADVNGNFTILNPGATPFTVVVSFIGYTNKEIVISDINQKLNIKLSTNEAILKEVEIIDNRLTDKQRESALTVEALDLLAIKETPAANFYDGLGALKGVDLTAASMGFKIINTRGFNSTSPVRSLQIIDGVDNQAPGLNFSLGNFLGASELDVQKVEIIVGASSAFYGPNAFNGVISMTTKSPFDYTGLTVQSKVGERSLFETAFRYAQKFKNKKGDDKFAYKLNVSFLRAYDWEAENYNPVDDSPVGSENPGGYDAVNIYGDEDLAGGNDLTDDIKTYPGLGIFYRNGYQERDLVDYNTRNLKLGASFHYRFKPDLELIYSSNFGTGTTVYQGENRFSLKNILFFQNKLELNKKDKFFLRFYATNEDAGDSYDAVLTAFKMLNTNKTQENWNTSYLNNYLNIVQTNIKTDPDYPPFVFGQPASEYLGAIDEYLANNFDSLVVWHQLVRDKTNNNSLVAGQTPFAQPGTSAFDSTFKLVTSTRFNDKSTLNNGGSLFFDRSALYHGTGEYKFKPKWATIVIGGSARMYKPNSQGTIFRDTGGVRLSNFEYGIYSGIEKRFFADKLKASITFRTDKNQNFKRIYSPAASLVYSPNEINTLRFSFSSAVRNPTLADQFLYYDVGRAILLGNTSGYDSLITISSFLDYKNGTTLDKSKLSYFDVSRIRPEQVRTFEIGYRTTLFKRLFVDASYYYSIYKDFIGFKIGIKSDFDSQNFPTNLQVYRISANTTDLVSTQGFSIGMNYYFKEKYAINFNTSWNELNRRGSIDPIVPAFNTPRLKFNLGISSREIKLKPGHQNYFGFNTNYKWIEGFLFEGSPQFTGRIPSYDMFDAQVNYTVKKWKTVFKLGASNLFGILPFVNNKELSTGERLKSMFKNQQYQVFGGPRIGRMAYFSVLVDIP